MTKSTKIVWNGCDGYSVSDESVFTSHEEFKPFDVVPVLTEQIPADEDGEQNLDGLFVTECGRVFKAA